MPSQRDAVLTDTVGFIRKLPHSLVAAFRATLEEVTEADAILLVADAAHPAVRDHVRAVYEVLEEIHLPDKPVLLVLNKVDIADPDSLHALSEDMGSAVAVSAVTGQGLDSLVARVDALLASDRTRVRLRIPQREARLVARLHESGRVLSESYEDNAVLVEAEVDPALAALVEPYAL